MLNRIILKAEGYILVVHILIPAFPGEALSCDNLNDGS